MLFVSTMLYTLAKKLGLPGAAGELQRQVQEAVAVLGADGLKSGAAGARAVVGIPAAFTIASLATLDEMQLHVNAGATVIGKGRSLAAAEFRESDADVWVSVDDDMAVARDTLEAMIAACRAEPCIVAAPYLLRGQDRVDMREQRVAIEKRTPNGARLHTIEAAGFGCVAMSKEIVERAYEWAGPERDFEHDGKTARALFQDEVRGGQWVTEDYAFFSHVPPIYPRYAVRVGSTTHAGATLDLATLQRVDVQRRALVV